MVVFENDGEIDPRLVMLIGVNVKETTSPIGFFGAGLKYAVACLCRWGETIRIQSGTAEFTFSTEDTEIRGRNFGIISMCSRFDRAPLGFTTELGKRWEPWMVYRELWCNAHDEPSPKVYQCASVPAPKAGVTRIIVAGPKIEDAHLRSPGIAPGPCLARVARVGTARAEQAVARAPLAVPSSVRSKFVSETASVCPACGRPM